VATGLCVFGGPAYSQTAKGETPNCPPSQEVRLASQAHLLGDWCGERTRLEQRGVQFDFQYVSDTLWGFKSFVSYRSTISI
jgi:porin